MTATIIGRSRRHRAAGHDRASIGRTDRRRSGAPPARTVGVRDAASSTPPAGTRRVPMVAGVPKGRRHGSEREAEFGLPTREGRRKRVRGDVGELLERDCRRDARPVGATVEMPQADAAGGRERQRTSETPSDAGSPGRPGVRLSGPETTCRRRARRRRGPPGAIGPIPDGEQAREPTAR